MGFNVQFGTVYKKHNSTYTGGSGSHWLSLSCVLKEGCSVVHPSLFVDISESELFSNGTLNHCYIPTFDRFYYVDNWTYERGHWLADCSIDVLASWKNTIGNSSQYVLRAETDFDGSIFDTLYPQKNSISISSRYGNLPWTLANGYYVVGIIARTNGGLGAIGYYLFTSGQFQTFCQYLFGTSYLNLNQITEDISQETFKALYNPFQYVVSCTFIPLDLTNYGQIETVDCGYWTIPNTSARRLTNISPATTSFTLAWSGTHPNAGRGSFVYCNPYTVVELDFQPFGHVQLPSDIVYDAGGVDIEVQVDVITGKGLCFVGGTTRPYMTLEAQVGVPIQLAQMSRDYLSMAVTPISSAASVAQSLFSGDIGGAIANAATGIDSSIRSQVPKMSTTGGTGGFSALVTHPRAIFTYYKLVGGDIERHGRPLCQRRTINSLSGFILCQKAAVETGGTSYENEKIAELMNEGFFYE